MGNRTRKLLTVGVIAAMTLSMAACGDTASTSDNAERDKSRNR